MTGFNQEYKEGNNMKMTTSNELQYNDFWQTQANGSNDQEYQLYVDLADDGKGGDITREGDLLKTYQEWLST